MDWIKCSERMPGVNKPVLWWWVITQEYAIARLGTEDSLEAGEDVPPEFISPDDWWMSLPEPPKEQP